MLKQIISLVVLIVLVKFFIVVVVSGSMEHNSPNDYTSWWDGHKDFYDNKNINLSEFKEFPFQKGLNTGDLVVLSLSKDINLGDIIIFESGNKHIIHRVISLNPLETKGDNNHGQGNSDFNINKSDIKGKALIRIPYLGYAKIWVSKLLTIFF